MARTFLTTGDTLSVSGNAETDERPYDQPCDACADDNKRLESTEVGEVAESGEPTGVDMRIAGAYPDAVCEAI